VSNRWFQTIQQRILLVWYTIRNKPTPDAIIADQLTHFPDEQAARIKRRLQAHREHQEQEEKRETTP
jgi:hypothetical protein